MPISNKYKNTLNYFINNLDSKSLLRLNNKGFYNVPRSKHGSKSFLEKNCLNKDVLTSNRSLWVVPKTKNFQLHQHYNVAFFDQKSIRV